MSAPSQFMQRMVLSLGTLALILLSCPSLGSNANAMRRTEKYGVLRIKSNPGGFPLDLDGLSVGKTTLQNRSFKLDPGVHTIVVTLPSGEQWIREVTLDAGRVKCVAIEYVPAPLAQNDLHGSSFESFIHNAKGTM